MKKRLGGGIADFLFRLICGKCLDVCISKCIDFICQFMVYLICLIEESCFMIEVYPVRNTYSCLILVLNIFLPGVGTMVQACQFKLGFKCSTFAFGWFQLITAPVLFGWVLAIYHAVLV